MSGGNRSSSSNGRRPFRRSPYAVLNLPQTFGDDDDQRPIYNDKIRDSYKRLSRLLHPDKRPPGKERDDAQELFIELQHAYETLEDPALRQAYDYFGHSAVDIIRHNRYSEDSLYRSLSKLHDDGKPTDALELLQIVLEDRKRKQRQKEFEFNADVEISMHACTSEGDSGGIEWPEVSSTNVSLMASVPMPPQTAPSPFTAQSNDNDNQPQRAKQKQKTQLNIGGSSTLEKGMGSTRGILTANYQPVPQTNISSELAMGRKYLETSLSSSTQLADGTGLSAKMTRQYELGSGKEEKLGFGFSSHRSLSIFDGRTVHAMFALGMGSDLKMQYSMLSLTTWGFYAHSDQDEESDHPPPRLSAKLTMGTQYPIECSIDQSHLFDSPHRSGKASVAWSPIQGYKLKGMLSRKISKRSKYHESEFASSLGMGVEHSGLSGLKWLIQYKRPEGLTVRIPIFVSSFMSPGYLNKVIWCATISYLLDESIEEWMGHSSTDLVDAEKDAANVHKTIATKLRINEKESRWMSSSKAKQDAERQLSTMAPVAASKRQREESMNGLVILKATYASQGMTSNISLDVTQQLQFWVENSQLCLPPTSKSLLLGFYDLTCDHYTTTDRLLTKPVKIGKDTETPVFSLTETAHRLTCLMNVWLSHLGIGREERPYQSRCNANEEGAKGSNENSETVTLTVRYKCKGGVYEIRVGDRDALKLPSTDAIHLGSSNVVS